MMALTFGHVCFWCPYDGHMELSWKAITAAVMQCSWINRLPHCRSINSDMKSSYIIQNWLRYGQEMHVPTESMWEKVLKPAARVGIEHFYVNSYMCLVRSALSIACNQVWLILGLATVVSRGVDSKLMVAMPSFKDASIVASLRSATALSPTVVLTIHVWTGPIR